MAEFQSFTLKLDNHASELMTHVGICDAAYDDILNEFDPRVIKMKALWDTGATHCVITPSCAKRLGVKQTGVAQTRHAGGVSISKVYLVNIILPNRILVPGVKVTECAEQSGNFDVIIGMNVIVTGDFSISNVGGKTVFSFRVPSKQTIDFVEEERIENQKNGKVNAESVVLNFVCPKCGKPHKVSLYYDISIDELNGLPVERCHNIKECGVFVCDHCKFDFDLRPKKMEWEHKLGRKLLF